MSKMAETKGRDAFGRRLLLGGTATLALAAAISAAPINFERSLFGDIAGMAAHADGGDGGGEGGGDGGGGEGGGGGDGGEGGGDSGGDSGGEGGDDSGGDDSGSEAGEAGDDDGTADQGSGDVPVDPNAPVVIPDQGTSGN